MAPLSDDIVKKLHRQRGHVSGAITSLVKVLDDTASRNAFLVQASLESMEKAFEKFEDIQEQLEENDEDGEIPYRETIGTSYNTALARARQYIHECEVATNDILSVKSGSNDSTPSTSNSKISIKMPAIPLPQFDSQIENWASFYDLFTSVTNENKLSDAGKLAYLKQAVTGKAYSLIEHFSTTNSNYQVALQLLKSKFDFPRRAIRRHWVILREYPKIPKDTPAALGNVVEVFQKHLKALENLGAPIQNWDITIIDLILSKIGSYTCFQWELTLQDQDIPPYTNLLNFLEKRANSADFSSNSDSSSSSRPGQQSDSKNAKFSSNSRPPRGALIANTQLPACKLCPANEAHLMYLCPQFKKVNVEERRNLVKKAKLCFNCLHPNCPRSKNFQSQCSSKNRCKQCGSMHHSSICAASTSKKHTSANNDHSGNELQPGSSGNSAPPVGMISVATVAQAQDSIPTVLLGSALIQVQGGDGRFYTLRAIVDSAATSSFISLSAATRIGLRYERFSEPQPVSGIGGIQTFLGMTGQTTCLIKPKMHDAPMLATDTTVIKKIVTDLPCSRIADDIKSHFSDLNLADKNFNVVKEVDFLIGADVFPQIYTGRKRFGPPGYPAALDSIFGWIITGRVGREPLPPFKNVVLLTAKTTDALLRKFWEIEELPHCPRQHPDDVIAEKMFEELHYRLPDGRYVVPLLLREDAPPLGDSKSIALLRLKSTKRRLNSDFELNNQYSSFLTEYEKLGHMTPVASQLFGQASYYLPHHYVTRPDSQTTKLRVIFDASQKSTSGFSLNDLVYKGPALQNNIFDIVLRFRCHQLVFTCDISKMYRQILIRPEDRRMQHIFWDQCGETKEYELNTVTYGISSSPFVALRTLKQLTKDEGHKYPLAAKVIDRDIYIDDLCCGRADVQSLLELKRQTVDILKSAGCEVQKWSSNCAKLLSDVPVEHRVTSLDLTDGNTSTKLLGIHWDAQSDSFYYQSNQVPQKVSKRHILSSLSRIFDPLGLISPIVFKAKTIMQKLWLQGIDWDDPVPADLSTEWSQFYEKLPSIRNLKVDRCVVLPNAFSNILIGYCDASSAGYCALFLLRSENDQNVKVSLIAAKSRVAPTKTISIPRLELCAAQLLATLKVHVEQQLKEEINIQDVAAFTDSQVVLAWIKTMPCQLKCFEANRVSYIQERIEPSAWRFIPSEQNPADLGSRGCLADQLENHPLWWTGPDWLTDPIDSWPHFTRRTAPKVLLNIKPNPEFWEPLISKFSNFSRLHRVTSWVLRYMHNLSNSTENRSKEPTLSTLELNKSLTHLIKIVQRKHFSEEIKLLEKSDEVPKRLKTLQPFLDTDGVLRVGGRIRNSSLPFDAKHPILLPKHDHFVNLIIDHYHEKYLHAGPRLLQSLLARQFWVLAARSIIRSRLSKCVTCFRAKPHNTSPLMADLPTDRVTPSKVFLRVQLDFGGPFLLREHRRRNPKLFKAYLCLFVCMATKAVHLELASELSTEAFLAAFDRFISRRGLCQKILSDNATNFTGAQRHLSEVYDFVKTNKQHFDEKLSAKRIEWSFIPPSGPHFGGLHEAGIKSAKYHLKRVIGEQTLTFEEMTTVFTKIEAIMNSRPLCQLSTDASEVDILTPGHFLVNGPLVAVPEYDWEEVPQNHLSRWQMLQKLSQHFWKSWSRDYLHTLIQRTKWQQRSDNLKKGTVVIIADADLTPTQWKKGIIEELHPGKDKVVRVVTVRTATGLLRRPVVKLYPLPAQ